MSTSQWRKFAFFNAHPVNIPVETINRLTDVSLRVISGSRNTVVLGDDNGFIHFLDRSLQITSFRLYSTNISLLSQVQVSTLIFSIGEDEPGSPSVFKVWDAENISESKKPVCVHTTRLPPGDPCILSVKEDLTAVVIGFQSGAVVLLTGDLTRSRSVKLKLIFEGKSPISGLAWKESRNPCIFISTQNEVYCYSLAEKEKEKDKLVLCDSIGCSLGCSVLADVRNESMLFIARNDAIYSYSGGADTRGTCYAFDGEKKWLYWYRGYLILVIKDEPTSSVSMSEQIEKHTVYVVDVTARSIVFSTTTSPVLNVFQAWGSLYVYTADDRLLELREKDLQTKLDILFKKNLYDVAISIAKTHQYDPDSLAELFRQYGDHLYAKGDHSNAMEQYVKTIGRLEPSYVIRKYLDSPRILSLTSYLEALHKEELASEDHTTLLINCYAKLRDSSKLNSFLSSTDVRLVYDVETAIKICRQGGYVEEALAVARRNGRYDAALKILIEDKGEFAGAIDYIKTLNVEQVESSLRQYGSILLNQLPDVTTRLVTELCIKFQTTGDQALGILCVEDFLPIFAARPDKLSEFLEEVLKSSTSAPISLYHILLENYLSALTCEENESASKAMEEKAIQLLDDSNVKLRVDQALIACQSTNFTKGVLLLYEKTKMYGQILSHHLQTGSWEKALSTCRRFGPVDPSLWIRLLRECVQNRDSPSYCMSESLNAVEKGHLMSPLLVIELLCKSPNVDLGRTREFILRMLVSEESSRDEDEKIIESLREESRKVRAQIRELQESAVVFQGSKCSFCSQPLDMPSVHFLCQHSFHQKCFDSYAENESECIVCLAANKKIREQLKALEPSPNVDAFFTKQLSEAENCFSVVAEYFGKGLFTPSVPITAVKSSKDQVKQVGKAGVWDGTMSEARLRVQDRQTSTTGSSARDLTEGKTRTEERSAAVPVQMSEGRLRLEKTMTALPAAESEARMRLRDVKSAIFGQSDSKPISNANRWPPVEHMGGSFDKNTNSSQLDRSKVSNRGPYGYGGDQIVSGSLPSAGMTKVSSSAAIQTPISPTNPFASDDVSEIDATNPFAVDEALTPSQGVSNPFESENPFADEDTDSKNPFE